MDPRYAPAIKAVSFRLLFGVATCAAAAIAATPVGATEAAAPAPAPSISTQHGTATAAAQATFREPASTPSAASERGDGPWGPRRAAIDPFALDLSAATWIPLSVGPELAIELPGRVLAQIHLGWMPELYSQTMTDALEDAGVYDRDVGNLVDGAVRGATAWRLAAGWRPFESAGLELTVGYAHVAIDGGTNTSELIPLVPADVADELAAEVGNVDINLNSSIHHFTVAAGWRWLIADRIIIRANLGYLQSFASSSTLVIESRPDLTALAAPTVEAVLHDQYMRYIKIPVVGLSVGCRLF